MITYLLDVNVLLKLHLPAHADFDKVDNWFVQLGKNKFATCAITQAGFVRVLTQQSLYTPKPIQLVEAQLSLRTLLQSDNHQFWPMDIGFLDATSLFEGRVYGHKQVTDSYLLGLAIHHKSKLATTDRGILHIAGPEYADYVELLS